MSNSAPDLLVLVLLSACLRCFFCCLVELFLFCSPLHTQEVFQEKPQVLSRVIHDNDAAADLPFKSAGPVLPHFFQESNAMGQ